MKKTVAVLVVIALAALLIGGLISALTHPGKTPPPTEPPDQHVGLVSRLQGGVEAGPESALEAVDAKRDLHYQEGVHVFNSGKATVDFGHGIECTLFNDTDLSGTSVDASGQVKAKLSQGGLSGYVREGGRKDVSLPNGGRVVILGTHYCIIVDPSNEVASVCNFDGSVEYSVAGGPMQKLSPRSLVVFDDREVLGLYEDLDLSAEDLENHATESDSAFIGLKRMEDEYPRPAPPGLAAPENRSTIREQPTFGWEPAEDAREHHLQVSTDFRFSEILFDAMTKTTYWAPDQAIPAGAYYWHVQSLNPFGAAGEWSETWEFTYDPPLAAPALIGPGDGSVLQTGIPAFSWQPVQGGARYDLQVSWSPDFARPEVDVEGEETNWAAPSPLRGEAYYWRVRAISSVGTAGAWSAVWRFELDRIPGVPKLQAPKNNAHLSEAAPMLSWSPVDYAASYTIIAECYIGGASTSWQESLASTQWTLPSAMESAGDTCIWRVQASNVFGTPSGWSNTWRFVFSPPLPPPPAVPTLLSPPDGAVIETGSPTSPTLRWSAAAGADTYTVWAECAVYMSTKTYSQAGLTATEWTLPVSLMPSDHCIWNVNAFNAGRDSGPSATWSFEVQ